MRKEIITSQKLQKDSWDFAKQIYALEERFDIFAGVSRGGVQIGIYIQEVFNLLSKQSVPFVPIGAGSYDDGYHGGDVKIDNLENLYSRINVGDRILVIDDFFDRGKTLKEVKDAIKNGSPYPVEIFVATLYYKPENRLVDIVPDFFYKKFDGDVWVVLPHELKGLSEIELKEIGFLD